MRVNRVSVSSSLLVFVMVVGFMFSSCLSSAAATTPEKVYKLTCQSVWPATHAMQKHDWNLYVQRVMEASKGRIKIDMFTKDQLVTTKEALNALQQKTVDMVATSPSYHSGLVAITDIGGAPMNFQSRAAFLDAWDNTKIKDIINAVYKKRVNAIVLTPGSSSPQYIFSNKLVKVVEDLKNMRIRVPGGAHIDAAKRLGAVPIQSVAGPDTYIALQKGMIDGAMFPIHGVSEYSLHEVCKYLIAPPYTNPTCMTFMWMNLDVWNSLPADLQQIFIKVSGEVMKKESFPWWENYDKENIDKATKKGMQVLTFSPQEAEKYKNLLLPVWDNFIEMNKKQGFEKEGLEMRKIILDHWNAWAKK